MYEQMVGQTLNTGLEHVHECEAIMPQMFHLQQVFKKIMKKDVATSGMELLERIREKGSYIKEKAKANCLK